VVGKEGKGQENLYSKVNRPNHFNNADNVGLLFRI
jgi:hypothetical protein